MASSINASTTAGVVTTADTSGVLNIQTAGTTAISIDASQAVSFTNSPTVTGGTANGVAYLNGSKVLTTGSAGVFGVGGTNLGLGVTPSAWTAYKVLQINKGSFLSSGTNAFVGSNWYYDGTDKFITNDYATFYRQYIGVHSWHVSTISGASANDPITFTQAMTLDSSGNLLVGTTSTPTATCKFAVFGSGNLYTSALNSGTYTWFTGTNNNYYNFYDGGGTLKGYLTNSGTFTNTSDLAYKKDITGIQYGLADVLKMRSVFYRTKDYDEPQIGFIAQEMELIIPEVVSGEEGSKGIAYGNINAVLVKAIQEQQALITQLQADVAALKGA